VPTPRLRLFVAGQNPRSQRAIEQVTRLCEETLGGLCQLEVIDIVQRPQMAQEAAVLVTPTLVRDQPLPERRALGDLSDASAVLAALGMAVSAP
jgi:circadian clock protein KaiB